jgi:hypothetical protein
MVGGYAQIVCISKYSCRINISVIGPKFMEGQRESTIYITMHEFEFGKFYHIINRQYAALLE